jgi:hypothetical protein
MFPKDVPMNASSILKIEAAAFVETLVLVNKARQRNIPEDRIIIFIPERTSNILEEIKLPNIKVQATSHLFHYKS